MNNIWSDNKYLNTAINVLMFLIGINFMHYGQLILPIVCFLLFIDNRMKFKVNSPKIFIVLCLFGIAFYAFTYKVGFYSVMGFTCPMAYYIGSNIKNPTEENIKKIVYLFAISMGFHVILNAIIEYILHGHHGFFMSTTHYDFWTREKIANTATAINADIIIGSMYYIMFHEKNKSFKVFSIIVFILSMFYLMVIGRRTPVIMLFAVFVMTYIYEARVLKSVNAKIKKGFTILMIASFVFVAAVIIVYVFDLFGFRRTLGGYHIIQKFTKGFINDQRFELYFGSFPLMPKYPFGGQHISTILGEQVHDFWIDIYDYAGIVPCALMIYYSILYLKVIISMFKSDRIKKDLKILMLGVFICIIMQMFFEPVMTGASLFLLISIIINALIERLLIDEQ